MALNPKQWKFSAAFALLLLYATLYLRLNVAIGDVFAHDGHSPNSYHYKKLAGDLLLFSENGRYLTAAKHYAKLGAFWKLLGGTWGGDFFNVNDANHFSWGEGKR